MMIDIILFFVGFVGLLVGSITDFQRREVADWINYALIFIGIGFRLIYSIISGDWWFTLIAIIFGVIAYIFGLIMFFTGQWGGGDSKMIIGLATLFATYNASVFSYFNPNVNDFLQNLLHLNFSYNLSFYFHFLFNSLIVGGLYGIVWTIFLIITHYKSFRKDFCKRFMAEKKSFIMGTVVAIFGVILGYFLDGYYVAPLIAISILVLVMPWLFVLTRSVENSCMVVLMKIEDLTEGEWIVDDVVINKKLICGPKDLGISNDQIQQLIKFKAQGKLKAVKVKIGIPFVPAFFISFLVTAIFGNLFLMFIAFG